MKVKNTDEQITDVQTDCKWDERKEGIIIVTDGRESCDDKIKYRISIFKTDSSNEGELSSIQTDYVLYTDGQRRRFDGQHIHIPKKVFEKAKQVTGLEWTDDLSI